MSERERATGTGETRLSLDGTLVGTGEGEISVERPSMPPRAIDSSSSSSERPVSGVDSIAFGSLAQTMAVERRGTPPGRDLAFASATERYEMRRELGRGQQGIVHLAFDRVLAREVALKIARTERETIDVSVVARFVIEARTMAQIAHPNIVPIYDAGVLENGLPFYAMPVLPPRTLKEVLEERARGDVDPEHALVRLLRSFSMVCMAIQTAHDHGIVHRDIKPANLVYGTRGEIMVADFGLARVTSLAEEEESLHRTNPGAAIGTPLYMSPEQARGAADVGPLSDVYSLGVVLYEIITGGLPIVRRNFVEQIVAVLGEPPEPPVARRPELVVPKDLADLAMRCLAKSPKHRPESARALVDEVDAWLEGRHERERKSKEVARLVEQARACIAASDQGRAALLVELRDARETLSQMPEHAGTDRKAPLWRMLEELEQRSRDLRRAEDEAIALLQSALALDGAHAEARSLLSEIHLVRMVRCEDQRDRAGAAEESRRAALVDPERTRRTLGRPSLLRVHLVGAERYDVELFVERDRVLVPEPARTGARSEDVLALPPGSYRVRARTPSGAVSFLPLLCRRGAEISLALDVRPAERAPPGFIYVAPGPAMLGGDAESPYSEPEREKRMHGFFVMKDPVSCAEYAAFLEALAQRDGDAAMEHAPRVANDAAPYWRLERGRIVLPEKDEQGDSWRPDFPVFSVSAHDAEAYARWRTSLGTRRYRLPTDDEWERSARGADGRIYPWGHHFDPAFCKMRLSRPGDPSPEPIGAFVTDVSPFGVRDLAGGVAEWTSSPYRTDPAGRSVRGGGWSTRAHRCAATFRGMAGAEQMSADLGFRLVSDLTS